jgi:hypothetical protein
LFDGKTLESLVDFPWSYPSPVQWSLLIILGYDILRRKGYDPFSSFFYASMTALGGGWLWELFYQIPFWVRSEFSSWIPVNMGVNKVFLVDFHIFALPLVFRELRVKIDAKFLVLIIALWTSYLILPDYAINFHRMGMIGANTVWSWVIRIPTILFLILILRSVKHEHR